ncbi:GNAT family N-acetyltransferase [Rubrobacter aplysinae]|uniref:GNAT family N-acetyltransferase n=1 Tax=Rubrobacter aplysinae TaxID=909625 RepID=UPI00064BC072|nr:GNAT family N-acetyltransferase [Rubrobacter aplysinae]
MDTGLLDEGFKLRKATPEDNRVIAGLVVEGFVDKFRPVFRGRLDRAADVMERWVALEHSIGGVTSLIVEHETDGGLSAPLASIGVRTGHSDDEALSRKLWGTLREQLGLFPALRSATLLSHPRYNPIKTEAYVERLVVTNDYKRRGLARSLLYEAEALGRGADKSSIGLHVSGINHEALTLYETEGYEEISRQSSWLTGYALGIRDWIYLKKSL